MIEIKQNKHKKLKFLITTLLFSFLSIAFYAHAEEPWGQDADMAYPPRRQYCGNPCTTPWLGQFAETMIRFHQKVLSPADGPRSHHKPSSSQYTLDAMRKYGFFRGYLMGCDRLMRENNDPWIYPVVYDAAGDKFKFDPVQ